MEWNGEERRIQHKEGQVRPNERSLPLPPTLANLYTSYFINQLPPPDFPRLNLIKALADSAPASGHELVRDGLKLAAGEKRIELFHVGGCGGVVGLGGRVVFEEEPKGLG